MKKLILGCLLLFGVSQVKALPPVEIYGTPDAGITNVQIQTDTAGAVVLSGSISVGSISVDPDTILQGIVRSNGDTLTSIDNKIDSTTGNIVNAINNISVTATSDTTNLSTEAKQDDIINAIYNADTKIVEVSNFDTNVNITNSSLNVNSTLQNQDTSITVADLYSTHIDTNVSLSITADTIDLGSLYNIITITADTDVLLSTVDGTCLNAIWEKGTIIVNDIQTIYIKNKEGIASGTVYIHAEKK